MAALIFFMLGFGFYMAEFVSDTYERFALVQIHKSWGFVAFTLALIRIAWRAFNPPPAPPADQPRWETLASHGAHLALYALIIAMPLSGWLMVTASELQEMYSVRNMVFGLFELPDPFQPGDAGLNKLFARVHFWCALALSALIGLHILAALKHHLIDRDNVLRRMIGLSPKG